MKKLRTFLPSAITSRTDTPPETVEKIFDWILNEINNAGYLSPETVFVDGTHIKANANIKKVVKKYPKLQRYMKNSLWTR